MERRGGGEVNGVVEMEDAVGILVDYLVRPALRKGSRMTPENQADVARQVSLRCENGWTLVVGFRVPGSMGGLGGFRVVVAVGDAIRACGAGLLACFVGARRGRRGGAACGASAMAWAATRQRDGVAAARRERVMVGMGFRVTTSPRVAEKAAAGVGANE